MALLILSDMAEREAALGYTAPHRSAGSITFFLPSFSNVGISRLDDGQDVVKDPAKEQDDKAASPKSKPTTSQQPDPPANNDER
jgi:hypothetical protein